MSIKTLFSLSLASALLLCGQNLSAEPDIRPAFLGESVLINYYDGTKDDLLTAGWSFEQLASRSADRQGNFSDPAWIRKVAYYNNIIALIDTTDAGGFGRLLGLDKNQKAISGYEYLGYSLDASGEMEASLMLQIPDNFALQQPCLIVAASSGSRGIYGAVGTVGFWALTHGCAIAYTDKGTGTGFYFFDEQSGHDVQGRYLSASASNPLIYSVAETPKNKNFLKRFPNAVAVKHAYSGKNKEKDFGRFVLQAGQFALYQLNQHFKSRKRRFTKQNTHIIAASISNGGVSSLRAGEMDNDDLFDAIVVSEPNVYPKKDPQLSILQGDKKVARHSVPGFDYFIAHNLYNPCALLTEKAIKAPFANRTAKSISYNGDWCQRLKKDGLITGDSPGVLADNSLNKLKAMGILENEQTLAPLMQVAQIWPALAATYSNQMGRYALEDNLCGVYFSAVEKSGKSAPMSNLKRLQLFATSNGIPPTAGINLAYSKHDLSDYDRAKCFYDNSKKERVRSGVNEIISTGNLKLKPTIIVHGRNDNLVAPNHTSRPYYAGIEKRRQSIRPDGDTQIRYYEVSNAQHFDAFTSMPQFADRYIPLHYYFEKSLDLMMAFLKEDKMLPPSQVILTTTRKKTNSGVEPLALKHLPGISGKPQSAIIFDKNRLSIPD